jgi:putative ABC transport system ATP-binding protein
MNDTLGSPSEKMQQSTTALRRPPPIVVRGLNHWFGEGEAAKQALFDIDIDIDAGKLITLVGPSGSGKTTLLTLIGCLRRIQHGSIMLLGEEMFGATETQLVLKRRQLGFIFQAHNLHDSLTAMQNVRMGVEVHGAVAMEQWQEAAALILTMLGLGDRLNYIPSRLSGGQKQRVAVARALVGNPEIILADEPTAALDKGSGMQVVKLLKRLGTERGTTTLMVTHDSRILDMSDRIISMEDGRIVS